jgi:hypothetical protein
LGGRGRWISEFEANLVYRVSFRIARAIQRNHVSKTKKKKKWGWNNKVVPGVMVHTFNPSTWSQRQVDFFEFKASQ